jgi:membrane-bound serine protease (ClpP class)
MRYVERSVREAVGGAIVLLRAAAHLSPNAAVLVLTAGLLLIYVELNRPGWIWSGALGLLATLFAVASLGRMDLSVGAVALVATAVALLALDLVRRTGAMVGLAATLALVLGLDHLGAGSDGMRVHAVTAVGCGVVMGAGTSILTGIARRARANKGLD